MRRSQHHLFFAVFVAVLLGFWVSTVMAAAPVPQGEELYSFLRELASLQNVPGFPPALFTPERDLSRFEIAFFLFRFDAVLAARAVPRGLNLTEALAALWAAAHPGAGPKEAAIWAEKAALAYRYMLIEYHREMGALGYRLQPDAYPQWVGSDGHVSGH
ncbi:MAG: hypothetical protein GX493_00640 [Firmicutes bacterium]|nr:hypothetical protein [Bacillota bacterium]